MMRKISYTKGCICDSLTVDGVETIDMSIEEVRKIVQLAFSAQRNQHAIENVFDELLMSQGEYMKINYGTEKTPQEMEVYKIENAEHNNDMCALIHIYATVRVFNNSMWLGKLTEEFIDIIWKLIDNENDLGVLQECLIDIVTENGEETIINQRCECCGDTVVRYEMEIKNG